MKEGRDLRRPVSFSTSLLHPERQVVEAMLDGSREQ